MNKLFTLILLLVSFHIHAAEKGAKSTRKPLATVEYVTISPAFTKPEMNLNKIVLDSLFARPVVQVQSLRKQTKRYRPVSAPGLQTKLNWVFAY
ncbi:MAG: hypothetical protein ACO1NU_10920 [Arcticibacter sp.]